MHYFGPWDDPDGALGRYEDFLAGRPTETPTGAQDGTAAHEAKPGRPSKPYPEYPLFPHATGYWAKKIQGKLYYFGPWADPDGALKKYLEQGGALHAGRNPKPNAEALTVKQLCNEFLTFKLNRVDSGELSPRTFTDYKDACSEVVHAFGKGRLADDLTPGDFADLCKRIAKKWGLHRLGKTIQCVRCLFRYGVDADLMKSPMRFGPGFKRPDSKTMRLEKAKRGVKLFSRAEILTLLMFAPVHLEAMILLGINAGLGNSDIGNLPLSALDLEAGWLDYPRPKTGIARRSPLWPETVEAIKEALAKRKQPKSEADAGLVFITKYGESWAKDVADSPITKEFRKLLDAVSIDGHRNFYTLRHTFRTVADAAKDQPAADHIMGHEVAHMSSVYRETISDERLHAVADHVRGWLFRVPATSDNKPSVLRTAV
jgi:integrase